MTCLSPVRANPHGGSVVHGDIHIGAGTGGHLQIQQSSANAIINWDSFSIAAGELTQFLQPGASSAVLNRVTGGDPSAIHGALQANGNVFVINPNGILVGPSGTIDVHGLVLSTLDVSDGEFLAGGDQVFQGASDKGVTNLGRINAIGGDVFLIGKTVTNSGSITASGRVGLAAGEEVLLTAAESPSGERIFVRATGSGVSGTGITNDGSIEGAAVEMKAHGNIYALAINNKGTVRATGASHSGGRVFLRGVGGGVSTSGSIRATSSGSGNAGRVLIEAAYAKVDGMMRAEGGDVRISATERVDLGGTVDVSSSDSVGGAVVVEGPEIAVGSTAEVDASGIEGGNVRIGGGFQGKDAGVANAESLVVESGARILANGADGDAGTVILWSNDSTRFSGEIRAEAGGSGHGGFVEVSGKETLRFEGLVSTLAANGQNGTLLLDPTNFAVIDGGVGAGGANQISNADLIDQLALGNVVIATDSNGSEDGTITVETGADVFWSTGNSLALLAHGDIRFNASVQNAGAGGVTAVAGWDGTTGFGGSAGVTQPGSVDFAAFVADPASYGNVSGTATGTIHVGDGSQTAGIAVGSAGGATQVAGHGLELIGGDDDAAYAQLGFAPTAAGPVTGAISASLQEGGLTLTAGAGEGSYAQVGHGGRNAAATLLSGNIDLNFDAPGTLNLNGGSNVHSYAQLGHGGRAFSGSSVAGDIALTGVGDVNVIGGTQADAYAQIGHGGRSAVVGTMDDGTADFVGDITIGTVDGGSLTVRGNLSSALNIPNARYAYAQIGHGGAGARGDGDGSIHLDIDGSVLLRGGNLIASDTTHAEHYAQIGHGGFDGDGAHDGTITINSVGDVEIHAGFSRDSYAQVGHGGRNENVGDNTGNIAVTSTAGSLRLIGGNGGTGGERAYAQLGHGGNTATGNHGGNITVNVSDEVALIEGLRDDAYKLLGHGGMNASGNHSGSIEVVAGGDVRVLGHTNDRTFAQIGHGGHGGSGNLSADLIAVTSLNGRIDVIGGFQNNPGGDGPFAYAQIGLGGNQRNGNHVGDIVVSAAGPIAVEAGGRDHTYALIGNGGDRSIGTKTGNITVTTSSGDITIIAGQGQEHTSAAIGHAGYGATGAATGNVFVQTHNGSVLVRSGGGSDDDSITTAGDGGSYSFAQIGHGGARAGQADRTGTIDVLATGSVLLDADSVAGDRAYVQIGHGGYEASGDADGTIAVTAAGGDLELSGGNQGGEGRYAKIGHGAFLSPGDFTGAIDLSVGGAVTLAGGGNENSFAQIGHGGILSAGSMGGSKGWVMGDITLDAGGDLRLLAGAGDRSFSLLGHGGLFSRGFYDGDILATIGGGVDVTGAGTGSGTDNFAQIGHSLQGAYSGFGGTFNEVDGRIVVDAISYIDNPDGNWTVVPWEGGPYQSFLNARGDVYLQSRQGTGDSRGPAGSTQPTDTHEVIYEIEVSTPGTYVFLPRWTGYDGASDSLYADILEIKDGTGGQADWYTFDRPNANNSDFNNPDWFTQAGAEHMSSGSGPAAQWTFDTAGTYTLRIRPREDGAALDAFVFQDVSAPLPTGFGPGATYANRSGSNSNITVLAQGNITITGGLNDSSHAAIGHGGSRVENVGVHAQYGSSSDGADISVVSTGGNILLDGNTALPITPEAGRNYAVIGHHGVDAGFDAYGNIGVHAEAGSVVLQGGAAADSFAAIGHSGGGTHLGGSTVRQGNIHVDASDGVELGLAATGEGSYAQIGHGGLGATGPLDGDVSVVATGGDVRLTGGSVSGQYAQIGHGGTDSAGSQSGNVRVIADGGGAVVLQGGAASDNYAMIGHGDGGGASSSGTRQGGVHIFGDGGLSATDGGVANTSFFHQTNGGLAAADYLGGSGFQLVGNGQVSVSDGSLQGLNTLIDEYYSNGLLSFAISNDIDIVIAEGRDRIENSASNFLIATGGNLTLLSSHQNAGSGSVSYIAGWEGSGQFTGGSVDYSGGLHAALISAPDNSTTFNNCDTYGHNGATLTIGNGAQTNAIGIGSQGGRTTLAAHGLTLQASTTTSGGYAQIGYHGSGGGEIDIHLRGGGLEMRSGIANAYVQIGHGGLGSANGSLDADISISFCEPGDLVLAAGDASNAYAQIGHGGVSRDGDLSGGVSIVGARDITATAGNAQNAYAQIGHGGRASTGNRSGNIEVLSQGNIAFNGGSADRSYAMLGHGGHFDAGSATGDNSGSIRVQSTGGRIEFGWVEPGTHPGNEAFVQLGHGGYNAQGSHSGDLVVLSRGNIRFRSSNSTSNARAGNYAQLGHGGFNAAGSHHGDITVLSETGSIQFQAGSRGGGDRYAQLGHGGIDAMGNHSGDIAVLAHGNLTFNSFSHAGSNTTAIRSYSQLGHGGHNADATLGHSGHIAAASRNGRVVLLGSGNDSQGSYAQIGHGGYDAAGAHHGDIVVRSRNDILLDGGAGTVGGHGVGNYAQIGHGGAMAAGSTDPDGALGGDITVSAHITDAFDDIGDFYGTDGSVGPDGAFDEILILPNPSDHNGIRLVGGANGGAEGNYVQIGHGGIGRRGSLDGEILIETARNIQLSGGAGIDAYAQIGHGGIDAAGSQFVGRIGLVANGSASLNSGAMPGGYAMIGHGGLGAGGSLFGGDICFHSVDGHNLSAGENFVQIGHGGSDANVDALSGNVSVTGYGDVQVLGGEADEAYAQIGHGGLRIDADMSGDVYVVSADNGIFVTGGSGNEAYAMFGHGDGAGTIGIEDSGSSGGTRQGGIQYFAQTDFIVAHGSGGNSYLHHRTNDGGGLDYSTTYLGGSGYQIVANGVSSFANGSLEGTDAMIEGNIGVGHIIISHQGVVDISYTGPDMYFDNAFDFIIMTGGNITMLADYQNAGRGRGILVAGWNGSITSPPTVELVDFCAPVIRPGTIDFNQCDAYGNNGATVTLGSTTQSRAVRFGSRGGLTAIAGHGIVLNASTGTSGASTQVGFYGDGSGDITGDIIVRAKSGGLTLNGGTTNAYAQIGHGGQGSVSASLIDADIDISFCEPGDVLLKAGGGNSGYAQIGHGGIGLSGDITGAVSISGADDFSLNGGGTLAYARIGHGGANGSHDISASPITVEATSVDLRGGSSQAYAQIGHGGYSMNGSSGDGDASDSAIAVTTTGTTATDGVHLRGGTGGDSYAMIGSGGRGGAFDVLGDVTVTSAGGGISLVGTTSSAFALIGNGGHIVAGDFGGTTTVTSNGGGSTDGILLKAGTGSYSFANIGHATNNVTASMLDSDTIVSILGGGLTLEASSGTLAVAAIGLQGRDFRGDRSGLVDVTVTSGDVTMTAGTGTASFAQIGHGGWGLTGSAGDMGGNVTLSVANGTLTMNGGGSSTADNYGKFAMIGHGGGGAYTGAMGGSVIVDVEGAIAMNGGLGGDGFTQIGHGGRGRNGTLGAADDVVRVTSRTADLLMAGGDGSRAFSMIGFGGGSASGATSGSVFVDVQGSIAMAAGDGSDSFTLIGHGGRSLSGTLGSIGDVVSVTSHTAGLSMTNGNGSQAFSMIGMGGSGGSGSKTGDVTVSTVSGVLMDGTVGDGAQAFLQIGHGGYSAAGSGNVLSGNISVTGSASNSGVTLLGGDGSEAYHYALIGHGGGASAASGGKNGSITVAAGSGGITLKGGGTSTVAATRPNSFAQIGHGGSTSSGAASGAIHVTTTNGGDIILHGGGRQYTHAQIGHGGRSSVGSSLQGGAITVVSDGKVELKGAVYSDTGAPSANSSETFAQIGHGGMFAGATFSGAITVEAQTGVLLESGASTYARAQVGHGGYGAGTNGGANVEMVNAAVTVTTATGGVILDATPANNRGFALAMIGNGGTGLATTMRAGAFRGDITVDGGTGNVELHSGNSGGSGAMIGNGGTALSGNHSGNIRVSADGDLIMDLRASVTANTFSRIGHGGVGSSNAGADLVMRGDMDGDIHVDIGGKAVLDASGGRNTDNYVQIGHGGGRVSGDLAGNVTVLTGGSDGIAITGGNGTGAYAQVGHGGVDSIGNKSGAIWVDGGPGGLSLTGGSAEKAYALVGHGGHGADGFIDGRIDVAIAGDLAVGGGGGASSFAQIGHSLAGARGGWGGLIEIGGLIVGEAEWYDEASNWVVRPEGFYPTNPGGTAPPPATFSGSRNGWFLEAPDGQPAGAYADSSGTYALYSFTTGSEGGTYRLYSHATGFNGNSDSLYMDIVELKDGPGGVADWYFMGTGTTGVFSWNTGNGGHEHTSGTTGPPVWDLDPNTTYTLRINPREDGVSIDSWMLANTSEGALFDPNAAVTFAEANGVGVGSDVNVTVGGNITLTGGAGGDSHAVIGHRGDGLDYDLSGNVHVEGQDIALSGGLGNGSSAQIGHGGHANANASGILDGVVHVRSHTNLSLQGGGSADRTNAIIGHGDIGMSGTHSGDVLIRTAGATVLADGNGSGAVLGHAGIDDTTGDTRFALITETLDNSTATLHGLGDTIARMLPNGSVDIGVQQGDLRVGGTGGSANSSGHVHLFAGGNVILSSLVQNNGTGSAGLVAGWDGTTGLIESYPAPGGVPEILALGLDIAPITGDDTTWGNNGGAARIGDGNQTSAVAFGSGGGTTALFGDAVTVNGSDLSPNAYAQIGTLAAPGTSPTGAIHIATKEGGVSLTGGNQVGTYAQIGHRSLGSGSPALSGDILIASLGGIDLTGGGELLASAQIGHGGVSSTIGSIGGDIALLVAEDIHLTGGTGGGTYAQVGHGGLFTHGNFSGDVALLAGGDIAVRSGGTDMAAYAKIGHGDDLRGALAGQSGTGTRAGDIAVSADANLDLENALIGHVYDLSRATATTGATWIGVGRADPTDPAAGDLTADAASEFSGVDEVRFYLSRRANNQIAAGATINGESFDGGALYEPWPVQRPDEYTNFLTDASGVTTQPGEHDNSLGSGPAPVVPGAYAMYFHQIELGGSFPVPPVDPNAPGGADGGGIPGGGDGSGVGEDPWAYGYASVFPDDRAFDDWLRDQEEAVTGWGFFRILYEGFDQYGRYGESTFRHDP